MRKLVFVAAGLVSACVGSVSDPGTPRDLPPAPPDPSAPDPVTPYEPLAPAAYAAKVKDVLTGLPLTDSTGGFKCFRRQVLEAIPLDRVRSNGYAFQIEMSFLAWKRRFRLKEVPIVFTDRVEGQSKMSKKIVREAIWMVWWLRIRSLTGRA